MNQKTAILLTGILLYLFSCNRQETQALMQSQIVAFFKKADATEHPVLRERIIDSAYAQLQNTHNDTLKRSLLFEVAARYETLGSKKKYGQVCQLVYENAKQQNDTADWARASHWIGDHYQSEMQNDSAFKYYLQAEKMFRVMGDSLNYGRSVLNKSAVLYHSGNFTEGINQGINALKVLKKSDDRYLVYLAYLNVALNLKEVKEYAKAIDYFNLSFAELNKLAATDYPEESIRYLRATHYNNIGTVHERLDENAKAIGFYQQGLRTENLAQKWPELYAALLSNLAYAKMKSGSGDGVKAMLLQSLRIRDSIEILPGIISSRIKIGEYHLRQKDTAQAIENFKLGYGMARKIQASAEMLQTLKLLTENDKANKDFYSDRYFKVNDSMQNVERATQNKFARIAYETEQIQQQYKLLSRRNKIIITAALFVLLVALSGFAILRLRSKSRELSYVKEQQQANEKIYQLILKQQSETEAARSEERNRIAMELHDGIVNSIFTTRFNLMQLDTQATVKKDLLVKELEKTEQEVRRVSHDLQNSLFIEDKNLPEILANLVAAQQNDFQTEFDLSADKYIDWSGVSDADKIHIYRIVQEAIQNVNKYAKAKRCLIMLLKTEDKITIRIWDDGIGFQTEKARHGIGLRNIRTRAEAMGGTLKITSDAKTGTRIEVVF